MSRALACYFLVSWSLIGLLVVMSVVVVFSDFHEIFHKITR